MNEDGCMPVEFCVLACPQFCSFAEKKQETALPLITHSLHFLGVQPTEGLAIIGIPETPCASRQYMVPSRDLEGETPPPRYAKHGPNYVNFKLRLHFASCLLYH